MALVPTPDRFTRPDGSFDQSGFEEAKVRAQAFSQQFKANVQSGGVPGRRQIRFRGLGVEDLPVAQYLDRSAVSFTILFAILFVVEIAGPIVALGRQAIQRLGGATGLIDTGLEFLAIGGLLARTFIPFVGYAVPAVVLVLLIGLVSHIWTEGPQRLGQ